MDFHDEPAGLHRRRQRLAIGMDRQKIDPHRRHPRRRPSDGFFDVEKFEVEENPFPPLKQVLDNLRSGGRIQLQADLHKGDLVLHLIHQPRSAWSWEIEVRPWDERF